MKFIYVCSPYRGDLEFNTRKTQEYCRFVHTRGAVPLAPHLHNPQFLDDNIPEERESGLQLGIELLKLCSEVWVFGKWISEGMRREIEAAELYKIPIRYFNYKCEEVVKR